MTLQEWAEREGVQYDHAKALAKSGKIPHSRVGWAYNIPESFRWGENKADPSKVVKSKGKSKSRRKAKPKKEAPEVEMDKAQLELLKLKSQWKKLESETQLVKQKLGEEYNRIRDETLKLVAESWDRPTARLRCGVQDLNLPDDLADKLNALFSQWAEECQSEMDMARGNG